ncbi:enoyl-CoA hydratase [Comamonas serinivorans]|uniref:Enoyl-CoA hydratase n=1 Tax=Comamonas serinivorans TaxID=1082851 RepID=A0A1Y0ELD9_9BURK|nr:crotonase/enoyl-CoA hydratase family protein [Comamonas serinivorans]ARU04463.1 enoyl-CoA hydratase [Comamonas serinivorans]
MNDRVLIEQLPHGVAHVQLVREDKLNAIDPEMLTALNGAIAELQVKPGLRAIVVSGRGRAFSAGYDFASFKRFRDAAEPGGPAYRDVSTRTHGLCNVTQNAFWGWHELPVPVIAAVHGVAFGAGLQLALSADIRLATADVQLSVMEIKWGLVPDLTGMARFRRLVRDDVARELTFTGRIVRGDEAQGLGLVSRVVADPLAEALALAAQIGQKNPAAIRAGKRLLNASESFDVSTGELLLAESVEQQALIGTPNQAEAVTANLEKRAPVFQD